MSLKKSNGNMYPWVTHMHTHLRGCCGHGCKYCYVQAMAQRFPNMKKSYTGPLWLDESQLELNYGHDWRTYFIEHQNDLFASNVPVEWVIKILAHCKCYQHNNYVFQTKNPGYMWTFLDDMPENSLLGATIETDSAETLAGMYSDTACPPAPYFRLDAMKQIAKRFKTFITVEPILKMASPEAFARSIAFAGPSFVNIGADSKGRGLVEPTRAEVQVLIDALTSCGVVIRQKSNLERLMK